MFPAAGSPWYAGHAPFAPMARRLYVTIDGREAFNRDAEFHPAAPAEAMVGLDLPAGSTTTPRFGGRIIRIEQLDPRLLLPKIAAADGK